MSSLSYLTYLWGFSGTICRHFGYYFRVGSVDFLDVLEAFDYWRLDMLPLKGHKQHSQCALAVLWCAGGVKLVNKPVKMVLQL